MHKSSVRYDQPLPEIAGRRPWERPTSFLVEDDTAPSGWRVDASGRRPSELALVPEIRKAVDDWRGAGYPGASDVTLGLFRHWFEDEHEVPGFDAPLRFHFGQREAIETLAWLVEIFGERDTRPLIERHWRAPAGELGAARPRFETTVGGRRTVRWRLPAGAATEQDLPPEDLRRYAFRMATGSGKTWVMAMAVVWSHLHRRLVSDSPLSTNFLIVAPNVIVYERLRKDFAGNAIFRELPLIPPEWKGRFDQRVILRGESTDPAETGNLFLTNIQQLYDRSQRWAPRNPVDALLGERPPPEGRPPKSMLERIGALPDLAVINDEAHHVHDEDLQWSRSLLGLHRGLPDGLAAWLDFSATPEDLGGRFFPWIVSDYPLAQAVEDRIVKAPVIVRQEGGGPLPLKDPDRVTGKDAVEKYGPWITAAVGRLKKHEAAFKPLGVRPILFITAESVVQAKAITRHLVESADYDFATAEVLAIHTDSQGELRKGDLDALRRAARDVDAREGRIRVIVSVLMLREGWDVRNVSIVLGLRPFSATAPILPHQVVGRGLRLMSGVTPDRTQTLEVLGTPRLLEVVGNELGAEGVAVAIRKTPPDPPVTIRPLEERLAWDIELPELGRRLEQIHHDAAGLEVSDLPSVLDGENLPAADRLRLQMDFATTGTRIHSEEARIEPPPAKNLVTGIAHESARRVGLTAQFALLYPVVRRYAETRCFGRRVELGDRQVRAALARPEVKEAVTRVLARALAKRTVREKDREAHVGYVPLSRTRPFQWRRDLPPFEAEKTVFNHVATYNSFERRFAKFLDRAADVPRFAALAATAQGSAGVQFRVDYLKRTGAIGFYYPDWVLVQRSEDDGGHDVHWIVETKGRVFEGTAEKDRAMVDWCRRASAATGDDWRYIRINQQDFDPVREDVRTFAGLLAGCTLPRSVPLPGIG